ncbi:hypothetical protein DPX16_12932 [Anabarilius grahami]|uniref:Uncharacterized protein n=1 Tax=Anabarilius grahami TaxID=495550 RepID=A0A3N0XDH7_ANAGA|nr:hypothetical protein DPX16_12932 [Anabarilius grahami]
MPPMIPHVSDCLPSSPLVPPGLPLPLPLLESPDSSAQSPLLPVSPSAPPRPLLGEVDPPQAFSEPAPLWRVDPLALPSAVDPVAPPWLLPPSASSGSLEPPASPWGGGERQTEHWSSITLTQPCQCGLINY